MAISMARYFRRQQITLNCRTVTPLFLGNADQEAEWRAAPFKGLLRYWWRVTQHDQKNVPSLLQAESSLFGSAGDKDEMNVGKSLVRITLQSEAMPKKKEEWPTYHLEKISHPETRMGKVDPLLYLAGMGLIKGGSLTHAFFPAKSNFSLTIDYPVNVQSELEQVLAFLQGFGAIGSRCRNGWGSFQIVSDGNTMAKAKEIMARHEKEWKKGFSKDYPNCLGSDEKGPLLWKTREGASWPEAMRLLADAYIKVRAEEVAGIGRLDPGSNKPAERHLLGVPLTNHPAPAWGNSARHGSPLRFIVRCKSEKYVGFVLHLPHKHSDKMLFKNHLDQVDGQIDVWKKVHRKLNALLQRAGYEECLT